MASQFQLQSVTLATITVIRLGTTFTGQDPVLAAAQPP